MMSGARRQSLLMFTAKLKSKTFLGEGTGGGIGITGVGTAAVADSGSGTAAAPLPTPPPKLRTKSIGLEEPEAMPGSVAMRLGAWKEAPAGKRLQSSESGAESKKS